MIRRRWPAVAAVALAGVAVLPVPVAGAASTVCVEVVVDYNQLSANRVSATCVVVSTNATGAQVLDARATKLGVPKPRYRADGLLCAIDGKPAAPDCAERTSDGGYKYWSYWHKQGDGAWAYSQAGPFDYTVTGAHPGEGWSWVEGTEDNSTPPAVVRYERVCPPPTPAPTTRPTTRSGSGARSSTSTGQATVSGPRAGRDVQPSATTTSTNSAAVRSSRTAQLPTPEPTSSEVALSDPPRGNGGDGPPIAALAIGAAVIVGLGGAAFWRARRSGAP